MLAVSLVTSMPQYLHRDLSRFRTLALTVELAYLYLSPPDGFPFSTAMLQVSHRRVSGGGLSMILYLSRFLPLTKPALHL